MSDILDRIVAHKRGEVQERQARVPVQALEAFPLFPRTCCSLRAALSAPGATGIIAEFKRRSPSKGVIHGSADVTEVTGDYVRYGATGLSVLTDQTFFGGADEDLACARQQNVPVLRKDFVIDPYQVLEAKAIGADVVLLIAECLDKKQVDDLASLARSLGMEVLLEMHSEAQLDKWSPAVSLAGVNNRDLKTFRVDIDRSVRLAEQLPAGVPRIAESGISDPLVVDRLRGEAGFSGFLIGEHFMKEASPGAALRDFVGRLALPAPAPGTGAQR